LIKTLSFGSKLNVSTPAPPPPPEFTVIKTFSFGSKLNVSTPAPPPPPEYTVIKTLSFGSKLDTNPPSPLKFTLIKTLSFGSKLSLYPLIKDETPANNSIDIDMYPLIRVYVEDNLNFDISWSTNQSIWTANNNSVSTGFYQQRAIFVNESNTSYWWTVNVKNTDDNWANKTFKFKTREYSYSNWSDTWEFNATSPNVTTVSSSNITGNSATLHGYVDEGGNISVYFEYGLDTNYGNTTSSNHVENYTYFQEGISGLTDGVTYHYRAVASNDLGTTNGTDKQFSTDISNVTVFNAESIPPNTINTSWNQQNGVDKYYLVYKIGSIPTSRVDGTLLANTTNLFYNHTNLNYGTHYYYSIWAYNNTNGFNENYSTADNFTNPYRPSNFIASNKTLATITLNWTKAVNSTHSIVVMNETGYADYPNSLTNGTEIYNNTGNSKLVTGLAFNTTYYFSLWSYNSTSNLYSVDYVYVNETTYDEPKAPTVFNAVTYNDTIINLNWVKGSSVDTVVIRMNTSSYPSLYNGTEIYNGTGTNYQKTGLYPSTKYYFRAWGYNSGVFSITNITTDNITLPEPPQNLSANFIAGTDLNITWEKGIGATQTYIRNSTESYPSLVTGNLLYNDTGEYVVYSGATSIDYFRAWSYNNITKLYSTYVNLLWGGLEINVYKETEPNIQIKNYTVFVSNQDGSETFEQTKCNNPFRIDVSDVPNGEDIVIQISREGYYTDTQYRDLDENRWYIINFYLSADTSGGGNPDDPDYIPPEGEDNETYGQLYLLTVTDIYDQPIQDAKIVIKEYINSTEIWEEKTIRYTDANGQVDVYLTPNTFYKVIISGDGYDTVTEDYIASPDIVTKTFKLYFSPDEGQLPEKLWSNISWRILPTYAYHKSNITCLFNISSELGQLEYFNMRVEYYNNSNNSYYTIFYQNISNNSYGGEITYTTPNVTGKYAVTYCFKKENFSEYCFDSGDGICRLLFLTFETISEAVSDVPVDIYFLVAIVLAIAGMGLAIKFGAGDLTGYIGLGIMTIVFMFRTDLTIGGQHWTFVLLATGIIYTIILFLKERL